MTALVVSPTSSPTRVDRLDFEAIVTFDDFVAAGARWDAFKTAAKDFFRGLVDGILWG